MSHRVLEGRLKARKARKETHSSCSRIERLLNALLFFIALYYGYYVLSYSPHLV
ncbi:MULTISPECIES: hypothetical protein [Methylomonas]|uniref:hypothetical protein n=1 Tax=Methylomonas TaxID=416 RepID=UPI000A856286|nr:MULTISPECIES: hypothetical protein [Methylomonas]ATG91622.1 hypothetical protein MKLM6_3435 [Methylomonas koyamae]WNB75092.1 hypothetical protein RI210_17670 [Methylomonas koyamae]